MRTILLGVLAAALPAGAALAQTYGLGVNAPSPDSVVLKIEGKNQTFTLGTGASKPAAEAFLTCLVNDRVIKVERSHGATKLLMLDDSNVADLLREYLQSNTSMDPCAVGKAAYTPKPPALKGQTPQAAVAAPAETKTAPAATETKPAPKKKLGRKAAPASAESKTNVKVLGTSMPLPPPAPAKPSNAASDSAARATTLGTAPVERPATAQTAPGLASGSTAPGIQPSAPTAPVPTATTAPTLPPAQMQNEPPVAPPPPPTKP